MSDYIAIREENEMKIMVQDRTMIIEQPRCVWVEQHPHSDQGMIASNLRRAPILGTYETTGRARDVLWEMFEFQRNGKCNYYMPAD